MNRSFYYEGGGCNRIYEWRGISSHKVDHLQDGTSSPPPTLSLFKKHLLVMKCRLWLLLWWRRRCTWSRWSGAATISSSRSAIIHHHSDTWSMLLLWWAPRRDRWYRSDRRRRSSERRHVEHRLSRLECNWQPTLLCWLRHAHLIALRAPPTHKFCAATVEGGWYCIYVVCLGISPPVCTSLVSSVYYFIQTSEGSEMRSENTKISKKINSSGSVSMSRHSVNLRTTK